MYGFGGWIVCVAVASVSFPAMRLALIVLACKIRSSPGIAILLR